MKDIEDIISRYLDQESTPEEEKYLADWLNENPEHIRLFIQLTHLHSSLRGLALSNDSAAKVLPELTSSDERFKPRGFKTNWAVVAASLVLFVSVVFFLFRSGGSNASSMVVYSAAVMKKPMDQMVNSFEKENAVQVRKHFGPTGSILQQIQQDPTADVFISADESFMALAQEKGLVGKPERLAKLQMVIAVPRGNPKSIVSLEDLLREDVRLGIGNEKTTAVGRLTKEMLGMQFSAFGKKSIQAGEVDGLALALESQELDAALVWRSIAFQHAAKVDSVEFDGNDKWISWVCAAPILNSQKKAVATKLVTWLSSSDKARDCFRQYGYQIPLPQGMGIRKTNFQQWSAFASRCRCRLEMK
jgi:molybdate transport system substrate-binding protein